MLYICLICNLFVLQTHPDSSAALLIALLTGQSAIQYLHALRAIAFTGSDIRRE